MIASCQLPFRFDPAALQADLSRLETEQWIRHFVPQNYSGEWSALPLRAVGGDEKNIYTHASGSDAFEDTPLLRASPYFQEVLASFRCPLTSVRLMQLAPGSHIKEHVDKGGGYEYGELRLHVPITTNPDVAFMLDGRRVDMQPGECWYLNVTLPHSVANRGQTGRVHMVIDCQVNDWMNEYFIALGFSTLEKYGTRMRHLENNIAELRKLDSPEAKLALNALLAQQAEIEAAKQERGIARG